MANVRDGEKMLFACNIGCDGSTDTLWSHRLLYPGLVRVALLLGEVDALSEHIGLLAVSFLLVPTQSALRASESYAADFSASASGWGPCASSPCPVRSCANPSAFARISSAGIPPILASSSASSLPT